MLKFSNDPKQAEIEMEGMIFYLTAFGYIDGDFDPSEKEYIKDYIRRLVESRFDAAVPDADPMMRKEVVGRYVTHFHEVFEKIDREIAEMWEEPVAEGEVSRDYVNARLKLRCFEIFRQFEREAQESLMDTIDELLMADGVAHPEELRFRGELAEILMADLGLVEDAAELPPELPTGPPSSSSADALASAPPVPRSPRPRNLGARVRKVSVREPQKLDSKGRNHPLLTQLEHHYSKEPQKLQMQLAADLSLIDGATALLANNRRLGAGKLSGHQQFSAFDGQAEFLDGHVHVLPPTHSQGYELTVLGDLHGCYSCLKAALMQSDFFGRVDRFEKDPANHPEPKLVLLGDYIDRGIFSYNGVLRTVLQLFKAASRYVYLLRGNHEYYLEHQGQIYGGVRPAEAINSLKPHAPVDVFRAYLSFFEAMPNILVFDDILFTHGGIPRDSLIASRYRDLGSLNDNDIRFQMMWSDPSSADFIPQALQDQSARFPFGREQARAFLHRMGVRTLIRGHEKEEEGIRRVYDEDELRLITLFSAGGEYNDDLPLFSSYRFVTPMAMTITRTPDGTLDMIPWEIDYQAYIKPESNAFYKSRPQIEHIEG